MNGKIIFVIGFIILLIVFSNNMQGITLSPNVKVGILDFDAPDIAYAGEEFKINITLYNDRIVPVILSLRVDFLNGMLEFIKKNIGDENLYWLKGKNTETLEIECIIREGDIDWYKEEYNVQAMLFRDYPILGRSVFKQTSTVRGIHVKSPFSEKDKLRIYEVNIPLEVKEENERVRFNVNVNVINEGHYDIDAWVQVNLIEKPSAVPMLENLINIRAFAAEQKEVGKSDIKIIHSQCDTFFDISCELRKTEIDKEKFNIMTFLFVNIDGQEYLVDSSTLYGVFHEQPFYGGKYYSLYIGIITAAVIIIIILILLFMRRRRFRI